MISANDLIKALGADNVDVEALIKEAAGTIEAYQNENKALYHKLEVLATKIEEYRAEEDAIKTALVTAQKMAEKIKRESNEAAQATIDSANAEAESVITKAREYSSNLIDTKTNEANELITQAQAKANEAINSSKIVAQDILDQAKSISDDLISKSKAEKEAYEILVSTIKNDAKSFVENIKNLYAEQLEILNNAKLESSASKEEIKADQKVEDVHDDVSSLVEEVKEFNNAIPEAVEIEEIKLEEIQTPEPIIEAPQSIDDFEEIEVIDDEIEEIKEIPVDDEPVVIEIEDEEEDEDLPDPMEALRAFSQNEITPLDSNASTIPEIDEDPAMEDSLFNEDNNQLPFENFFNVSREDVHNDKSQTVSLLPPDEDDDDEPKFKGFFKKKK